MHKIFTAAALLTVAASSAIVSSSETAAAQGCGTYIIAGCFKDWNSAESRRRGIGAPLVVDTNNFPKFRNGWFCAADGPWQSGWQEELNYYQHRTDGKAVRDAYAKAAC